MDILLNDQAGLMSAMELETEGRSSYDTALSTRASRWKAKAARADYGDYPVKVVAGQISGSLQAYDNWGSVRPQIRVEPDPYRRATVPQGSIPVFGLGPVRECLKFDVDFAALDAGIIVGTIAGLRSKVIVSYVGKVELASSEFASVTLRNEASGEQIDARCDFDFLSQNHLDVGDEFRCEVVRTGGSSITRVKKLQPKPISRERVREVSRELEGRWNFEP